MVTGHRKDVPDFFLFIKPSKMIQVINHPSYLFAELHEAIRDGYSHCFLLRADGSLLCPANPNKQYEIIELKIKAIACVLQKATLYLIETNDGLYKGTMVDYWEHYSE